MKRAILLIGILLVILYSFSSEAISTLIYNEQFDNQTSGISPNCWSKATAGSGSSIVADFPSSTNKSGNFTGDANWRNDCSGILGSNSNYTLILNVRFNSDETQPIELYSRYNSSDIMSIRANSGASWGTHWEFFNGASWRPIGDDGNGIGNGATISLGKFYRVRFLLNTSNGTDSTWYVSINDTPYVQIPRTRAGYTFDYTFRFSPSSNIFTSIDSLQIYNDSALADTTIPTFSNNITNVTNVSILTTFMANVTWADDTGLALCIPSIDNGSGSFVNQTITNLSVSSICSLNHTVNATRHRLVRWRFYANDTSNNMAETLITSFNVSNTFPIFNITPNIIPFPTGIGNNITCNYLGTDADSDTLTNETVWYNETPSGIVQANQFNNITTIGSGNLSLGQNWSCSARIFDGYNYTNWSNSTTLRVGDTFAPNFRIGTVPSSITSSDIGYINVNCTDIDSSISLVRFRFSTDTDNRSMILDNATSGRYIYNQTLGAGTYNASIFYCLDDAGNMNETITNIVFTISGSSSGGGSSEGGGGSGAVTQPSVIKCDDKDRKWELLTERSTSKYDAFLPRKSRHPKSVALQATNLGNNSVTLTLTCSDVLNKSQEYCQYVSIDNKEIKLSPTSLKPENTNIFIGTNPNADYGDTFFFNIQANDGLGCNGKLEFQIGVSWLGFITKSRTVTYFHKLSPRLPIFSYLLIFEAFFWAIIVTIIGSFVLSSVVKDRLTLTFTSIATMLTVAFLYLIFV